MGYTKIPLIYVLKRLMKSTDLAAGMSVIITGSL